MKVDMTVSSLLATRTHANHMPLAVNWPITIVVLYVEALFVLDFARIPRERGVKLRVGLGGPAKFG